MSKGQREMTYEELKYAYMILADYGIEVIEWITEQAERVQELEDELIVQKECFEELQNNHIRVCNQNKRYREALEFYADRKTYERRHDPYEPLDTDINNDRGEKARKALEESE